MRVVKLLHVFPTFSVGGPQVRLTQLANGLGPAYRHSIIALDGQYDCLARFEPDLAVSTPSNKFQGRNLVSRLLRSGAFIRRQAPDLLLTYNWGSIEWALANGLFAGCRHLHFEDGFGPEEASGQLNRRILFRKWALRQADKVVVPSVTLARLAQDQWQIAESELVHIPNGIELDQFDAMQSSTCHASVVGDSDAVIFGTVAALRPEKNINAMLRAYRLASRELGPTRLLIIGDGPERSAIDAEIRRLGLEDTVDLVGHVNCPGAHLAQMDIFVLSSLTEQMPMSLLEAMAANLPATAFDVGDVKHMLAPSNHRFVCSGNNEVALATAMAELAKDPPLRGRVGSDNRTRVTAEFRFDQMLHRHRELLKPVASE